MTIAELLPFQERSAMFLAARRRAFLFDEQRVGKTPAAVVGAEHIGARTVLVVCPAIARQNWMREFVKFSGRTGGFPLLSKDQLPKPLPDLMAVGYDMLIDPQVYKAVNRVWDLVVLDEAHYVKSADTKRSRAGLMLASHARYAWALTGTPEPNNAGELWALTRAFGFTELTWAEWLAEFCVTRETNFGTKIVGTKNADKLKALLAPHMLRRRLKEVAPEMPELSWETLVVEPGPVDLGAHFFNYRHDRGQLVNDAREQELKLIAALDAANDQIEEINAAEGELFRRLVALQKVQPVSEIVRKELRESEDAGSKIVIFAWHRDVLRTLAVLLPEFNPRIIDGNTSPLMRDCFANLFRERHGTRVLLCQIRAAATNIDLSVADDVLFVELDWTPANNAQAASRVVSQFKRRPVRARTVAIAGSVDERVQSVLERKMAEIAKIFS